MRRSVCYGYFVFGLSLSLATGCTKKKPPPPPPVPVSGKVVFANGTPVANMVISFHPLDEGNAANRPSAALDQNGKYALEAAPGRYKVTLATIPTNAGSAARIDLVAPSKGDLKDYANLLTGFRDAKTSPLAVTIPEGGGALATLTVR